MTLDDFLDLPLAEQLKYSTKDLETLLAPYFPAVRKPALPPESSKKQGLENKLILSLIEKNKDLIASIQKARKA